jgi:hypothetical protein
MRIVLPLLFLLAQVGTTPTAREAVERIRAKTPVEAVNINDAEKLAGRYTSASNELGKRVGGFLSGDDLYLFPDGTYIYCEWTDVSPVTVYDKGAWTLAVGLVELKSDPDVTWDPAAYRQYERRYASVRRSPRNKEILLVGVGHALSYFEEKAGDDPEFMLLVLAKKRESTFDRAKAAAVKAQLMKEAWRPESFQESTK